MKTAWLLARLALSGALAGIGAPCPAEPIITKAKVGDLELTLILESENAYIGRPYPVEVVARNTGAAEMVLSTVQTAFIRNFNVKVFNLSGSSPVPLTLQGQRAQDRSRLSFKEVKLAPGEEARFFNPMLGWFFDLSVPARYRLEVTWPWATAIRPDVPKESQATLSAEFALNPDPDMRSESLGSKRVKALSAPGAKADKAK